MPTLTTECETLSTFPTFTSRTKTQKHKNWVNKTGFSQRELKISLEQLRVGHESPSILPRTQHNNVVVEEDNTLVIRSNGKRKREDGNQEDCKYIRLERRASQKLVRKFCLPED
ncbi:hypothetical protein Vadar_018563 [Vaccinium darrowii]|uniref:Uncharacterized protein n=1 Tax=Vaccinium darrowii TaxID=229202 RepID=A0ACB7Y0A1_9ERIC|nr:hypothetical protein Vadar_018563 [Vaccinium darrowii]